MSDTVKLIIEIPKEAYNVLLTEQVLPPHIDVEWLLIHGIPLDDVRAEIKNKYYTEKEPSLYQAGANFGLSLALVILDNIGKAESEDKNDSI